jgi:hypothetical protein
VALRELLLEPAAIEQHELDQLGRGGGQVDRPGVALLDHDRQVAAVVEVGVGDEEGVERLRIEAERDPVADGLVGAALEHPAVDEDLRPRGGQQELGPGDRARATEEGKLQVGQTWTRTTVSSATAAKSRAR